MKTLLQQTTRLVAAFSLAVSAAAGFAQASTTTLVVTQDAPPRAERAEIIALPPMPENPDRLSFNFRGAPLDAVLDYLSRAAGYIILKEADMSGTVDIISHQPLTRAEAVNLVNTVLNAKGYAAIANGRTLLIVTSEEAKKRNLPIFRGNDPALIPRTDDMVTYIIPVKHASAQELIDNIQELLPDYATITANNSSNSIILTDTQNNIHRMVEIIQNIDQSISSISELRVFRLNYAYAAEAAALIQALFATQQQGGRGGGGGGGFQQFFGRFGGGGGRGGGENDGGRGGNNRGQTASAALQASQRVTAAADERTNSVIVSAPADMIPTIEQLIESIDRSPEVNTVVRVFPLRHSSAEQTATHVTAIFGAGGQAGQTQRRGGQQGGGGNWRNQNQSASLGQRALAEKTVLAVADTRTNSVIVSAVEEIMEQVGQVIAELDQNPAKSKKVFVYSVKNANPEDVSIMLQDMFASGSSNTNRRNTTNTNSARGGNNNQGATGNRNNANSGGFGSLSGGNSTTNRSSTNRSR